MRVRPLLIALMLVPGALGCARPKAITRDRQVAAVTAPARTAAGPAPGVDFATRIRPILEARCQPCHFAGGKLYARLPFDRAETILELREKLFTRIKDENERRAIREFLSQHPPVAGDASHKG